MSDTAALPNRAKKAVALSGVTAGNTALCTVGRTGNDLHYRGYDILDVAETCEFEEIAYLLVHGKLPTRAELAGYKAKLQLAARPARIACKQALEALPAASHPMDVMRTGVSALGCVLPEKDDHNPPGARDIADRLMASLGSMLLYWYHFSHNGKRIDVETDDDSIGGHFLHLLHGKPPQRDVGPRDAHLADPLRRARVQRLDLHRRVIAGTGCGHVFGDHRRASARCAAPSTAAPTKSSFEIQKPLRHARRGRGRHPQARRQQGSRHRLRPPGLHDRRSAQQGDQGSRAAAVAGRQAR